MIARKKLLHPSVLVLVGAVMALSLAGCDQKKDASSQASAAPALPLTTGPATPVAAAPPVSALPAAPRVRVVRVANPSDRYAYLDRAYEMSDALGDAPPDYGFEYDGVRPWVWRSFNHEMRLAEPVEGGDRIYFYRPGAAEPYLVRDPYYSYGFSDGQLVVVYDDTGHLLPPDYIDRRADDAGRYLARGVALYEAALRRERHAVNAANWAARRAELDAERARWEEQQSEQDDWRAYHAEHEGEFRAYWQGERDERARAARSFDAWRSRGYNGPPPAPVNASDRVERNGPFRQGPARDRNWAPTTAQPTPPQSITEAQRAQSDAARAKAKAVADAHDAQVKAAQQKAEADAAAHAKAAADAAAKKADNEAALARQKAQFVARQAEAKAAADAAAKKAQADAMRMKADAAKQAREKAIAAAAARRAQAEEARAKAQAEAAAQAKALADAHRAQADAARTRQKAQAEAAQEAQAKARADAAAQARAKAEAAARQAQSKPATPIVSPASSQPLPAKPTPEQIAARRAAAKKAHENHHPSDDAEKPPNQP